MSYIKVHTALFNNPEFGPINYENNIREMDWSVGAILKILDNHGISDDTIVFFTSDNGPFKERGHEGGETGPLSGAKGQTYEGGIRVPGIMRYPHHIPSDFVTNEPVSTMDIFPTTLGFVDKYFSETEKSKFSKPFGTLDGKDIGPMLKDFLINKKNVQSPHDVMFHYCGENLAALRFDGKYKVVFEQTKWEEGYDSCPSSAICGCQGNSVRRHDPPLVYDLDFDISEKKPLPLEKGYVLLKDKISIALSKHLESFKTKNSTEQQENQMHFMQNPWLLPCCNPPSCKCDNEISDPASHEWYMT